MIYPDRVFSYSELRSQGELVEAMTNHVWPLCCSFFYSKLLYLSEGDGEDSPEYAILTIDDTVGHHGIARRKIGGIKPREYPMNSCMDSSRR
jgi:hypothetical protein